MTALLLAIPDIIKVIALVGMCISLLATVLVRITPSQTDDEKVNKYVGYFLKLLHILPTFGVNPQTVKLQEELERLRAEKK